MAFAGHSDKQVPSFEVKSLLLKFRFSILKAWPLLRIRCSDFQVDRFFPGDMTRRLWLAAFLMTGPTLAQAQDPAEILRNARLNNMNQSIAFDAKLRGKFGTLPLRVALASGEVSYEFADPAEKLILNFSETDSSLRVVDANGKESKPSPSARIRGSGLTYEDLSMQFLYWPMAKLLGEETLKSRSCYQIEVHPLRRGTAYGVVRLWVDKASGAIMRMEGFDGSGRLAKRFEVIGAQKLEDQWFLKTMRVETFVPDTGKISDRAYLEVTVPE